ncbi:rod-binding protein [Xylophilus sp. GW821-FHT01B05]
MSLSIDAAASTDSGGTTSTDLEPVQRARIEEAARKFEGFFIAEVLRQMRRSTRELAGEDGMFQNRVNDDMLDMADTLVADSMASPHAFGIADVILRQLLPGTAGPAASAPLSGAFKPAATAVAYPKQDPVDPLDPSARGALP